MDLAGRFFAAEVQAASFGRIGLNRRCFKHEVHLRTCEAGCIEPGRALRFGLRPVMLFDADLRIDSVGAPTADKLKVIVGEDVLDPGRQVLAARGYVDANMAQRLAHEFSLAPIVVALRNEDVVQLESPAVQLLGETGFAEQILGFLCFVRVLLSIGRIERLHQR